jgi:hypothetical protein
MSPLAQITFLAHEGGSGEEVTDDQCGVPEREMEMTDQPRWAAARQMRLPEAISNQQSAISNQQSAINSRQSAQ